MQSKAATPEQYIKELPADRKEMISALRDVVLKNLPKGFAEEMNYGMLGYVVPHSVYPPGYHCDPKLPLPFMAIASQKNFIAFYHMGIYARPECSTGSPQNIQSTVKPNWIWVKAVCGLKSLRIYLTN